MGWGGIEPTHWDKGHEYNWLNSSPNKDEAFHVAIQLWEEEIVRGCQAGAFLIFFFQNILA